MNKFVSKRAWYFILGVICMVVGGAFATLGSNTSASLHPAAGDLTPVSGVNLTGTWKCDDGATYYIRRVGVEVFWYCKSQGFNNVFYGKLTGGDIIAGKWADVPPGEASNNGKLTLEIKGKNRIEATKETGGFGGTVWTRQ